jgi:hypothetical protein
LTEWFTFVFKLLKKGVDAVGVAEDEDDALGVGRVVGEVARDDVLMSFHMPWMDRSFCCLTIFSECPIHLEKFLVIILRHF